mgnify:CR=1 FL=1
MEPMVHSFDGIKMHPEDGTKSSSLRWHSPTQIYSSAYSNSYLMYLFPMTASQRYFHQNFFSLLFCSVSSISTPGGIALLRKIELCILQMEFIFQFCANFCDSSKFYICIILFCMTISPPFKYFEIKFSYRI